MCILGYQRFVSRSVIFQLATRRSNAPLKMRCPHSSISSISCRFFCQIGFIGLGNMGMRMVNNLAKYPKLHALKVYDANKGVMERIDNPAIKVCTNIKEAVRDSSYVITMLPNDDAVRKVYFCTNDGILNHSSAGSLLIDCSTTSHTIAKQITETASIQSLGFIDAPVSGGTVGAENASLSFMVGGKSENVEKCRPLLLLMGKMVHHCGGSGTGQLTKICNNLVLAITMLATSEAMNLGQKYGLSIETLTNVINSSSGRNWVTETYHPVPQNNSALAHLPANNNYNGGFSCNLLAKDLHLAQGAANGKTTLPMTTLATVIYDIIVQNGYGNKDFSIAFKLLNNKESKFRE